MTRSIAFVYVLGLFLLGIVVGALGMHLYQAHSAPPGPVPPLGRGMMPGDHFWERVKARLDLTSDQEEQIEQIIHEARADGERLHEEMMPRVHELMERTHDRLVDILTPEQREIFEQMHMRQRRGAEWFFLGHGPPQGHRPGPGRRRNRGSKGPASADPDP